MVAGRHKSRTLRRVPRTTPGHRHVMRYKKRTPSSAKCADCKAPLQGVIRARTREMKNSRKTQKRVSRPFGGNLCSKCARQKIIASVR